MSTFTVTLDELVQSGFDLGLTKDDYPIFDETYRDGLNQKIIDHYAMYEIGLETDGMFRFALNRRMREIMPYYNQLYKSEQITFDPLSTMKFTEDGVTSSEETGSVDSTTNATNTSNSGTDSRSRSVNSELPQVRLAGDEDYATSANDSVGDTNTTGSGESDTTTNETSSGTGDGTMNRTMEGYQGHAAILLMQYRESLLNIDMQVIRDLGNLFMGVWDNGDEFNARGSVFYYGYPYPTI